MNPLVLLPLLVAGCVAAPAADAEASIAIHAPLVAAPYALPTVAHEVTAHVPAGVELKAVGEAVAIAPAVVGQAATPGYAVQGEISQISQTFPEPPAVEVDVNALPVLSAPALPIAHALPAVSVAEVPKVELKSIAPAVVAPAVAPAVVAPAVAPAAVTYSNLNLNIPAPVPEGEAPSPDVLVQRIPVKALGRASIEYTPQITEVRPELQITEKSYDVAVPKPVYKTEEVTPVVTKHVPEPYAVPQPYAVPKPYAVPQPYNVPVPVPQPVHVQHHAVAAPAPVAYAAAPVAQVAAAVPVAEVAAAVPVAEVAAAHPIAYGAAQLAMGASPVALGATQVALGATQVAYGAAPLALGAAQVAYDGAPIALGATQVALGAAPLALGAAQVPYGAAPIALGAAQIAVVAED